MGQKVHPTGFRLEASIRGILFGIQVRIIRLLREDILLRKFILAELKEASVEKIIIERPAGDLVLNIYTAKPGVVIGRSGAGVEELKKKLRQKFFTTKQSLNINIKEVERPSLSAALVLQGVISDLERRVPFRRAVKQAINKVQRAGAQGVKVIVSGRLNGADRDVKP